MGDASEREITVYEIEALLQIKVSSDEHHGVVGRQRRRGFGGSDPTTTNPLKEVILSGY